MPRAHGAIGGNRVSLAVGFPPLCVCSLAKFPCLPLCLVASVTVELLLAAWFSLLVVDVGVVSSSWWVARVLLVPKVSSSMDASGPDCLFVILSNRTNEMSNMHKVVGMSIPDSST